METPKEYYYTYYSYEEWGRIYIGSRGCKCLPEEDIKYFGSFHDKTFKPSQKNILGTYNSREEAYADEIILHDYYDVANNSYFANRAKATSTKFYISKEIASKIGKINGKIAGKKAKELKLGFYSLNEKQKFEARSKGGKTSGNQNKKFRKGIFSLTFEQRSENGKKANHSIGGLKAKELGKGIFNMSKEELSDAGKKGGKIGGKKASKITNTQKWMCCETEYVSTAAGVVQYQKARRIDTSKNNRIRIS